MPKSARERRKQARALRREQVRTQEPALQPGVEADQEPEQAAPQEIQEERATNKVLAPAAGPASQLMLKLTARNTPLVALVMLVVGALCGFGLYPLLSAESAGTVTSGQTAPASQSSTLPEGAVDSENSPRGVMMSALIEQTRHFRGDPDAPVTMIEFGDFQ